MDFVSHRQQKQKRNNICVTVIYEQKAQNGTVRILAGRQGASISNVNDMAYISTHHMTAAAADLIRSDRFRADRGRTH